MRALLLLFFFFPPVAGAHSGGLDSQGGHTESASNSYHCHTDSCRSVPAPAPQVTPQAEQAQYDRDQWPHWLDSDGDCYDTRAEVLIASSERAVVFAANDPCRVDYGRWWDPYTAALFHDAQALDIDHLVPLRHAHDHGGQRWDTALRRQFANDPDNLLAVSLAANRSKGGRGPEQWRPPNQAFWCDYARRWLDIKQRYQLQVSAAERAALDDMLAGCQP